MSGQSAKAKGKRRALPDDALCLNVRFTWSDTADLSLVLSDPQLSVREFKHTCILPERPQLADKTLRLIYLGRMLSDGVLLLPWLETMLARSSAAQQRRQMQSHAQTHEEVSDQEALRPGKSPETAIWLNCSVAELQPTPEELAPDANTAEQGISSAPARGCMSFVFQWLSSMDKG